MVSYVARSGDTGFIIDALELAAAAFSDWRRAASHAGAAEIIRNKADMPASPPDAAILEHLLAPARAAIASDEWDAERDAGRVLTHQ
jgi:hypothetical protein